MLLLPEIVELDPALADRLAARAEELTEFGLVLEAFGTGAVIVREVPALVAGLDLRALVRDLADELAEWGDALALRERIESVCGTLACHSSVRAGRRLTRAKWTRCCARWKGRRTAASAITAARPMSNWRSAISSACSGGDSGAAAAPRACHRRGLSD